MNRFFLLVALFFYFSPLQSATTYVPVYTGWNDPGSGLNQCLSKEQACSAHGALAHLNASGQCVYNVGYGDQIIYLQQCGKSCGANSTGNTTLCTCNSGYEWLSGNQCVSPCGSGTVRNSFTQQCQAPCPPADTIHSEFDSGPDEFYPGSFCKDGCAIRSEIVVDICGSITFPGAECSMQGHVFSYTGQMCGANNPPPTGPATPPSCDADKDKIGDVCFPKCGEGGTRNPETLKCSCPAGFYAEDGGGCKAEPKCKDWQELKDHQCVDKSCDYPKKLKCGLVNSEQSCLCIMPSECPPGATRDSFGNCMNVKCPDGSTFDSKNYLCKDNDNNLVCPEGTVKEDNKCVPSKDQCPYKTHVVPGCGCVPDGSEIQSCKAVNGGGPSFDLDGDGQPNSSDPDVDGDGTPNSSDPDIDGDGTPNNKDSTPKGPASSGRLSANGDDDGDGIPNSIDGNADLDGDGVPNAQDDDDDGDGVPDAQDGVTRGPADCNPKIQNCNSTGSEPGTGTGDGDGKGDEKNDRQAGGSCEAFVCSGDAIDCSVARGVWETKCLHDKRKFDANGSRNCADPPICEGDPIDCAVVRQSWESNCMVKPDQGGVLGEIKQAVGSTYQSGLEEKAGSSVNVASVINNSGFLSSSGCPAPLSFSILGKNVSVSFQPFCDLAISVSGLVVGFCLLIAVRIVSTAF